MGIFSTPEGDRWCSGFTSHGLLKSLPLYNLLYSAVMLWHIWDLIIIFTADQSAKGKGQIWAAKDGLDSHESGVAGKEMQEKAGAV